MNLTKPISNDTINFAPISCEFIDGYGNDLFVVNAARVSHGRSSRFLRNDDYPVLEREYNHKLVDEYTHYLLDNIENPQIDVNWIRQKADSLTPGGLIEGEHKLLSFRDFRLINFLARKHHWSPFAHSSMTFRVKAPIFLARQLSKHQVGLNWNEVSRRYYTGPIEYYRIPQWRSTDGKFLDSDPQFEADFESSVALADKLYRRGLAKGYASEQLRAILPQNMMAEFYWSGTLAAFLRVCRLRLEADSQSELERAVAPIAMHLQDTYPASWIAHSLHKE